jgi:TRAP-type C4-dicarboxylate transport system permease small subunit
MAKKAWDIVKKGWNTEVKSLDAPVEPTVGQIVIGTTAIGAASLALFIALHLAIDAFKENDSTVSRGLVEEQVSAKPLVQAPRLH